MAIPPRSVSDATRFTSTTPHASMSSSSPASYAASSAPPPSRFQSPSSTSAASSSRRPGGSLPRRPAGGAGGPSGGGGASDGLVGETPEQKVARLRAAHHAAKNAKVSQLDRVIAGSRRLFDSAHRFTIIGLISFTAIAGVLTAYTAVDMMRYNKQRKQEFLAAQEQMDADSLAAARLAFMRGDASPAQTALVEAARQASREEEESRSGSGSGGGNGGGEFFKVPSLLGAPKPADGSSVPAAAAAAAAPEATAPEAAQGLRQSGLVRAVEDKALSALERERTNQRTGGPLDRIGLEGQGTAAAVPSGGKSWWKFW